MGRKGRYIPNELTNFRWRFNYQQKDAAKILGVPQSKLSLWESGKVMPDSRHIMRLKKLYKATYEDLYPVLAGETTIEIDHNVQEFAREQNEKTKN